MNSDLDRCRQRYRQIIGALPCCYIYGEVFVNGKGEPTDYAIRDVNHSFSEITGLSREKVLGNSIRGLFSTASPEKDMEIFSRVAINGDPVEKEFLSPFLGMYFRLFCFSPERGTFVALLSDISSEKKYRGKVEFLQNFANSTSDEMYILDSTGRFLHGNRAVLARLGVEQLNLSGIHLSRLNPLADEKWWSILWSSLVQKGSLQFETEHRNHDGEIYPVELSIDLMDNEGFRYACFIAKDISSKRALSRALLKDQHYAERAASAAGYIIWIIDSSGYFRPILGGDGFFVSGPAESVFFPLVHPEEKDSVSRCISTEKDGSSDFRMQTGSGYLYHRAVWSRVDDDCTTGVCYPISGAGLSGAGSDSAVMDTYSLMVESIYRRVVKMRDTWKTGNAASAMKTVDSFVSEFASLAGHSASTERVRFDLFLSSNEGMLKHLLEPSIPLQVQSSPCSAGQLAPSVLENLLVRLLLVIQNTERTEKVLIQPLVSDKKAGIRVTVYGRENIQKELDSLFIHAADGVPGLASVYAMVRSAGGKLIYDTRGSTVEFTLVFPMVKISDDPVAVLLAIVNSVDAARVGAALRHDGFSVAVETDCEEILRILSEEGAGVLIASASILGCVPSEIVSGMDSATLIQIGGKPPEGTAGYLPDDFRTGELVSLVREVFSKAEKPQAEDLQDGILWTEPHLMPPLF